MSKKRWLVIIVIVAAAVILTILLDTMLANHQPAITSLEAEPERVLPSGSCQIMCTATDHDGDELSYGWSASGGTISGITITGEGATVAWKAPRSEGSYNITVIVTDNHGSSATDSVTITVRTNRSPTINSLIADAAWTLPSGSLQVICTASDPDGDELSYEWTATGGNISGTGASVNWTAPQEVDIYHITVVVTDAHGSADTITLPITVASEQPPIIQELLITAEHCYLRTSKSPYWVGRGKDYNIQCFVEDAGIELSYKWSCTSGKMSGEGSTIAWTAPNTSGKVTITVTVSDIAGHMAAKSLLLDVRSCSSCSFPGCTG